MIRLHEELFPYTADEKPPKRLRYYNIYRYLHFFIYCNSLVNITDITDFIKTNHKSGGSLFLKSYSPKPDVNRNRIGSVPSRFALTTPSESTTKANKGKKFTGLGINYYYKYTAIIN